MKTAQLITLCFTCLFGIIPAVISAQSFVISADGDEVTDQKTGLIWRRCSEGTSWNGSTCAGSASVLTQEAALQQAAAQAAITGVAWRLPNIKELASIADKSKMTLAIDSMAFPVMPGYFFWSASPFDGNGFFGNSSDAWYVNFNDGSVSYGGRTDGCYVRLVRGGQ
jgi:hypothetical protein